MISYSFLFLFTGIVNTHFSLGTLHKLSKYHSRDLTLDNSSFQIQISVSIPRVHDKDVQLLRNPKGIIQCVH